MREEGAEPLAMATGPALHSPHPPPAAPAAEHRGLRAVDPPRGLAEHKSGRPAVAARQGDRGEGRLQSRVTSQQNNSRAVGESVRLMQLITCVSPCVRTDRSEADSDPTRMHEHVRL